MAGVFFDTTLYVKALRTGDLTFLSTRSLRRSVGDKDLPVWLSAVVLEELYAGASDIKARKLLEKVERDYQNMNRLIVPQQSDWATAGKLLNKLARKYGLEQIGRSRLVNDTLIAITAARTGTCVLTANAKDFAKIGEFKKFDWVIA